MTAASETTKGYRPATVLLVDDDPGDRELTRRALANGRFRTDLRMVAGGEQALDYLNRQGEYTDPLDSPVPDLILLDLNMPRMDGREVLEKIRSTESIAHLAVVILTTSNREADVLRSYKLGCQSFITKPVDMKGLTDVLMEVGEYWFQLVTLPPKLS